MRLIIISNRLPVTIGRSGRSFTLHPSAGGLATGLNSLSDEWERLWIGWPGIEASDSAEEHTIRAELSAHNLVPVFLSQQEITDYYEGFSNKTIWPHFHYFTQYTGYDDQQWETYQRVNQKFAQVVAQHLRPDDLVWVHDYHLLLLPALIREIAPTVSMGFFLHIPFPSYEIFRTLPYRRQLLNGILGADLIGFHTFGYMRHFLSAAYRITGHEQHFGRLNIDSRTVNVDVFPMGIDYDKFANADTVTNTQLGHFDDEQKLVLSVDRLDYTKGIPERVAAFEQFLAQNPHCHGRVTLAMVVVPSRSGVAQYQQLKHELDEQVGRINAAYGTFEWTPIRYFYRSLAFDELTTIYQRADVALLTPLRDGMNLVAKEYIASKQHNPTGVLILSEMTGASNELSEALIVNPHNSQQIVNALEQALEMEPAEQAARLRKMQSRLQSYTVQHWANLFIEQQRRLMLEQQTKQTASLTNTERADLLAAYQSAENRLIVLDYDGTLMGFQIDPQAVKPDDELRDLLARLTHDEHNHVVVSSGRDRTTLEQWLGDLPLDFAAEHGVWTKQGPEWYAASLPSEWKAEIRPMLEDLVERTPGSFVEEKDYSLAWHYRNVEPAFGAKRVREFRDVLAYMIANQDLQVLEGNKVVEIKNAGVNKGKAIQQWLDSADYDFIFAIGDDHTDEDTFKAMPSSAYTIKVGLDNTAARFNVHGVRAVRQLLRDML